MNKLTEFADSTLNFGETLLKKIDEINISDSFLKDTADRIAKTSEELIKEGSNTSLSFLKRTKEVLGQHFQNAVAAS